MTSDQARVLVESLLGINAEMKRLSAAVRALQHDVAILVKSNLPSPSPSCLPPSHTLPPSVSPPSPTPPALSDFSLALSVPNDKAKKPTRMREDWHPTVQDVAWAMGECEAENGPGNYERFVGRETEDFRDYWMSKSKDATKLDWGLTWRRWMRKAIREYTPSKGVTASTKLSAKGKLLHDIINGK
jgi:hypothetical protein